MSTVAEIESAIERLPIEQVRELAAWLEQYQATIDASSQVFAALDAEEGPGEQWHAPK
jgi:erythromycin esterase-like protein